MIGDNKADAKNQINPFLPNLLAQIPNPTENKNQKIPVIIIVSSVNNKAQVY